MAVTRTLTGTVNANVLSKEAVALGLYSGITVNGQDVTFLDTDDGAAVDAAISAYTDQMTTRDAIVNAYQANVDYINLAAPTNAQVVAQVKALTRQLNGLVRLLNKRGLLD